MLCIIDSFIYLKKNPVIYAEKVYCRTTVCLIPVHFKIG